MWLQKIMVTLSRRQWSSLLYCRSYTDYAWNVLTYTSMRYTWATLLQDSTF